MEIEAIWPLFGLEIETPRLLLRPVRDEDLPQLTQAALDGVHEPDQTPFGFPWTDALPADLPRNLASYQWSLRNRVAPNDWTVAFAVHCDGKVSAHRTWPLTTTQMGSPSIRIVAHAKCAGQRLGYRDARRTAAVRVRHSRRPLGRVQRNVVERTFAGRIGENSGYELNGVTRASPRSGQPVDEQKVRLARERFNRPPWQIKVRGAEPALGQLGIRTQRH